MDIKVLEIRFNSKNGKAVKAFADLQIGPITVRDLRVLKHAGKREIVACPQTSWRNADGKILYKTLVTFPDDLKGEIDILILSEYRRELENVHG